MEDLNPKFIECLGRFEICIEIDRNADPAAMLRSSNSVFCIPLPVAQVEQIMVSVKQRAGLDATACVSQVGVFEYASVRYRVNCCPQQFGEIVVLRQAWRDLPESPFVPSPTLERRPEPIRRLPRMSPASASVPATPSELRLGLMGRLRRFALAFWRRL